MFTNKATEIGTFEITGVSAVRRSVNLLGPEQLETLHKLVLCAQQGDDKLLKSNFSNAVSAEKLRLSQIGVASLEATKYLVNLYYEALERDQK